MKVLIIDDEVIIRDGISTVIEWDVYGFQLLKPAASAEEGLEIIRRDKPDIIFTDIKMNGMSGLEMSSIVKKEFPESEIIILSGYDDFTYAQTAIREGVNEYLLKTSGPEEIIQSALQAKERIIRKREKTKQDLKGEEVIKKNRLERLILNNLEFPPNKNELFPNLRIENNEERIEVSLIFATENDSKLDYQLLDSILKKELENIHTYESMDWNKGVLLIRKHKQIHSEKVWLENKLNIIERELGCNLFVAAGSSVENLEHIHQSYKDAMQAAKFKWLMDFKGYVSYNEVKNRRGIRRACTLEEEAEFITILKSGDREKVREWITQLFVLLKKDMEVTPESLELYLKSLIIAGYRWLSRVETSLGNLQQDQGWKSIDTEAWINDPKEVMSIYVEKIMDSFQQLTLGNKHYSKRAIMYIHDHIDKDISLQEVANYVHINPNYLSEVFKREVGKSYIEYVKDARMEKALSILIETPAKVSEVARQVGYEDIKYFSKQFRKYTGYTPSDYRKKKSVSC